MLDLKARYEPSQETPYIRSVNANSHSSKPVGKGNSFNRILNKANQRQFVNNESDNDYDARQLEVVTRKNPLPEKTEKKVAVVPGNADQQYEVSLEEGQSDQLDFEETRQATAELDQSDEDTDTNTGLLIAMPQATVAPVEELDQSSSVNSDDRINDVAMKTTANIQTEVPLDETKSLTGDPARSGIEQELMASVNELNLVDQINGAKATERSNNSSGNEEQPLNERKASEPDLLILQSQEIKTDPTTTDPIVTADLIEGQSSAAAPLIIADSKIKSNTANGVLTVVAQAVEVTESDKRAGKSSTESNQANQIAATEADQETLNPEKANKTLTPEDIRYKLIAKTLVDSSAKPGEDQSTTDIKKLMVIESQRLSAAKSIAEESTPTDTPAAKSQAETLPTVSGLERAVYTPAKTGLESQTVASQSPASTADPKDLIEQIVKKAEILTKAGNTEIKIQLKPEFMGKMIIKIAVEDGLVTAKFITESQHVKQLLEANLGSLKQNLESQGLKVDRTEVNVQLDNGGSFQGNDSGRQQMWQEYSDRNAQNRFNYQTGEDYQQNHEVTLESYTDPTLDSTSKNLGDGKVDFMI